MKVRYLRHLHYLRAHFLERECMRAYIAEKQFMREIVHANSADSADFMVVRTNYNH